MALASQITAMSIMGFNPVGYNPVFPQPADPFLEEVKSYTKSLSFEVSDVTFTVDKLQNQLDFLQHVQALLDLSVSTSFSDTTKDVFADYKVVMVKQEWKGSVQNPSIWDERDNYWNVNVVITVNTNYIP